MVNCWTLDEGVDEWFCWWLVCRGVMPCGQRKRNVERTRSRGRKAKQAEMKNAPEITCGSQVWPPLCAAILLPIVTCYLWLSGSTSVLLGKLRVGPHYNLLYIGEEHAEIYLCFIMSLSLSVTGTLGSPFILCFSVSCLEVGILLCSSVSLISSKPYPRWRVDDLDLLPRVQQSAWLLLPSPSLISSITSSLWPNCGVLPALHMIILITVCMCVMLSSW